mmetsp:Transcript_11334/g.29931  ORF Transcript_11334/g.29931 Transcript_11334/m.29931 type:complete len:139 (+) Transcript_11334:62-478(+)
MTRMLLCCCCTLWTSTHSWAPLGTAHVRRAATSRARPPALFDSARHSPALSEHMRSIGAVEMLTHEEVNELALKIKELLRCRKLEEQGLLDPSVAASAAYRDQMRCLLAANHKLCAAPRDLAPHHSIAHKQARTNLQR